MKPRNRLDFKMCPLAIAASAMFAVPFTAGAAAPGDALGPPFVVLAEPELHQAQPSVARDSHGNTIVVWRDASTGAIFGRRFAADSSPLDGGFRISQSASPLSDQTPDVAMDAAGDFVVAWQQSSGRLLARRYTADGAPAAAQFFVDTADSSFTPGTPAIAMDAVGDFVIGWQQARVRINSSPSNNRSLVLGSRQIVSQRYDRSGVAQGSPAIAGSRPDLHLESFGNFHPIIGVGFIDIEFGLGPDVDVAMDSDGDYVLAWGSNSYFNGGFTGQPYFTSGIELSSGTSVIHARRYGRNGVARGLAQQVSQTHAFNSNVLTSGPAVAIDQSGNYVVAWRELVNPAVAPIPVNIFAQRFSANGLRRGDAVLLSNNSTVFYSPVSVASNATGDFVVTWQTERTVETFSKGISARRIGSTGTPLGPVFSVSGSDTAQTLGPRVASDPIGNFVIVWPRAETPPSDLSVQVRSFAGP